MRSRKQLIRLRIDLRNFFSFQMQNYNPGCGIYQDGLIRRNINADLRISLSKM